MKTLFYILCLMAFAGGFSYSWKGFHEMVSGWFGCMRYTYDVVIWRHDEEEVVRHRLRIHSAIDAEIEQRIVLYFVDRYPEYVPFSVVSISLVKKDSVIAQTFWKWLYRACTRTADDAVREWKDKHGLAV